MKQIPLFLGMMLFTFVAPAQAETSPPPKVKYKSGKDLSFDELLIQGQLKRPEVTVVTGDAGQGQDGLIRLRENFLDRMAADFGEETQTP